MAVTIQDVLALLPELFPGVQKIPYANLHPNPDNPGAPLSDEDIQELADNLADRGLVNPLKVQPDPANPLAGGVKPHADNPRLTADGRPWGLGDFNFRILAGERRYRAAGRLGWATLAGFILNPTAEEAVEITHLDNDVRDRGWWAGYQSIEQLIKANPSLTQRQVGARLKMNKDKVTRAIGLLPLLNAEARALIVRGSDNSNKGNKQISELALARLADLGPGSTLKPGVKKAGEDSQKLWPYPAISAETQDLVRRTLTVAIDEQLPEAKVRVLVAWVHEGHQPEEYKTKGKPAAKVTEQEESLETDEEDDEDFKPITWSENSKHPEYLQVPVSRTRVHSFIASCHRSMNPQRKALFMQAIGRQHNPISVRRLTEAEKKTDPNHDYELFDEIGILKGAEILGWPQLDALVYDIDEWEGVRLHNFRVSHSVPLTWVEDYAFMDKMLANDPEQNIGQLAIKLMKDPREAAQLLPVMKLLNDNSIVLIVKSIRRCIEDGIDVGGWRFSESAGLELKRLEGVSKDPQETQRIVEKVIEAVTKDEDGLRYLDEVIDWVLEGNNPEDYFEKEA
jgi:hypothetical protein